MLPLLLLATLACHRSDPVPTAASDTASPTAPTDDAPLDCATSPTWETFGKGFVTSWCTPCHARALDGADRQGAPEGVELETLDDVLLWAARIQARAVDQGDMPPGGGPSAADLDRLATFLACGAPGEPTGPARCTAPADRDGGTTLASAADADALCALGDAVVTGDLLVRGDVGEVPCICRVDGVLDLDGATGALPSLDAVGGLAATLEPGQAFDLPGLVEVQGSVDLEGGMVHLGALTLVEGAFVAQGAVDAPRLQQVEQLTVREPGTQLALPRLVEATSGVVVRDGPELASVSLDALTTTGGLHLEGLALTDFAFGFDSLAVVGGDVALIDLDCPQLDALSHLETVQGELALEALPDLAAVDGLRRLTSVEGDLRVVDLPSVDPAALTAWADGIEVGGTLELRPEASR